ncbi:hypothetical protein STEG23_015810 [Scotinomys teguina]
MVVPLHSVLLIHRFYYESLIKVEPLRFGNKMEVITFTSKQGSETLESLVSEAALKAVRDKDDIKDHTETRRLFIFWVRQERHTLRKMSVSSVKRTLPFYPSVMAEETDGKNSTLSNRSRPDWLKGRSLDQAHFYTNQKFRVPQSTLEFNNPVEVTSR